MSKETHQGYHSFLIRCWLMPGKTAGEPALWRFELREVPTEDQKHRFSDLERLKEFISAKLEAIAAGNDSEREQKQGWKEDEI